MMRIICYLVGHKGPSLSPDRNAGAFYQVYEHCRRCDYWVART